MDRKTELAHPTQVGRLVLGPSFRLGSLASTPAPNPDQIQLSRIEFTERKLHYRKLCDWVETNIEETFTFYRLPLQHHKHMKSTNMLERLNEEIKRRTRVIRIFPNEASCLRLVRALAVETHENWIEATRYLNMELLEEHKKEVTRKVA